MKDCVFCTIVNKTDMAYNAKWVKTDLYEDDSVVIRPARGMSVQNYLMVIAKKHYNGFAESSDAELLRLEKLINKICEAYFKRIGVYPIILSTAL